MGNGAAAVIASVMAILIENENSGIMMGSPVFPFYSGLLSIFNGKEVLFHLDEEAGWQIPKEGLERAHQNALAKGITPRALVLVNPGNPTGQVLRNEDIEMVIRFCHRNNMAILADEVYQENVFAKGIKFTSVRKILKSMEPAIANSVELVSFHSASKGQAGECGMHLDSLLQHRFF